MAAFAQLQWGDSRRSYSDMAQTATVLDVGQGDSIFTAFSRRPHHAADFFQAPNGSADIAPAQTSAKKSFRRTCGRAG